MSYPAALYPRKRSPEAQAALDDYYARQPLCEYLVTWAEGTLTEAFPSESAALSFINLSLRLVRGVTDAMLTGPEHDYCRCECDSQCGRVFRDGQGVRIPGIRKLFAEDCREYRENVNVLAGREAAARTDERNSK